jgi:hypothetical protein
MNGTQFLNWLQCIGYDSSQLSAQNFDWLFDYEPILPFFHWLHDELQTWNVLEFTDMAEFHALELCEVNEGCTILDGSQLLAAMNSWLLIEDKETAEPLSESYVMILHEQLQHLSCAKQCLGSTYDRLVTYQGALSEKLTGLEKIASFADMDIRISTEQMQLDNAKMNKMLELVLPTISALFTVYGSVTSSCDTPLNETDSTVFLFNTSMDDYHDVEECFTQCLVNFTKKNFVKGVAEVAGHVNGDDYELLEISNPDLLLSMGAREDFVFNACKELSFIQLFYPIGEIRRVNALAKEQCLMSACDHKEWIIGRMKDRQYFCELSTLRVKLESVESLLAVTTRDMLHLTNMCIPKEVNEAASLQGVRLLRGDYDLKIARQDYFNYNQDQVIRELIAQRSRNEFLNMLLEIESRWHHVLHRTLMALLLLLQKSYFAFQLRMKLVSELEQHSSRTDRTTVDSRDGFIHGIHQVVSTGDETICHSPSLFVTYSKTEQKVECLLNHIGHDIFAFSSSCQLDCNQLNMLNEELSNCGSAIYSKCGTETTVSTCGPLHLFHTMMHLDELLKQLEHVVIGVIKDVDNKKKVLQKDLLMQTDRELFTYFFNASNRLQQVIKDLESRLHAHLAI